jgi:hypothetical protein
MKPLDPVEARLFPTLAAYARKARRRSILALIGLTLSVYIIGRDVLSAYQGRVATENMQAVVRRVNDLEAHCQKTSPSQFITTKTQAQDWAWEREKAKKE